MYQYNPSGPNTTYYAFAPTSPWKDAFYKKMNIDVTNGEVNESVALDRIVAQLQLRILDPVPAEIKYIYFSYSYSSSYKVLEGVADEKDGGTIIRDTIPPGTLNRTISAYVLPNGPFDVTISCYSSQSKLFEKIVKGVICLPNKRTVISGNLFTDNQNYTIDVDDVWGPPIDHPF